jgi:hypothetical protein
MGNLEAALMPATTGMKGAGYYDQHSTMEMSAIQDLWDRADDAALNLPLPAFARPITVLDHGSSEGSNAVRLMIAVGPEFWPSRSATSSAIFRWPLC